MTTYIPYLTLPYGVFANPAISILLPIGLGTAVGYSTRPSETQKTYLSLRQPPGNPPPWVFGPVWTALYGTMGYAAYRAVAAGLSPLASIEQHHIAKQSATLYTLQLGLNLVWMPLFFGIRRADFATVDIVALLGANGYLTYLWSQLDSTAAWCQAPYLAWLSFATYLCVGAGRLNGWNLNKNEVKRS